jgi:hypothetical protein
MGTHGLNRPGLNNLLMFLSGALKRGHGVPAGLTHQVKDVYSMELPAFPNGVLMAAPESE